MSDHAIKSTFKSTGLAAALLCVLAAFPLSRAGAAVITVFTDLASWQTAVGSSTTIDFEGPTGAVAGSEFSGNPGSPVFSLQAGASMAISTGNTELVPTSGSNLFFPVAGAGDPPGALAGDPIGEVRVAFGAPIFAMGAFFLDIDLESALAGIGFDLTDDAIPDVTLPAVPGGESGSQAFLGFVTDTPVSFVDLHIGASDPARDGVAIDDLSYALAETVPEPGALALFGLGLAGFGLTGIGMARRNRARRPAL